MGAGRSLSDRHATMAASASASAQKSACACRFLRRNAVGWFQQFGYPTGQRRESASRWTSRYWRCSNIYYLVVYLFQSLHYCILLYGLVSAPFFELEMRRLCFWIEPKRNTTVNSLTLCGLILYIQIFFFSFSSVAQKLSTSNFGKFLSGPLLTPH